MVTKNKSLTQVFQFLRSLNDYTKKRRSRPSSWQAAFGYSISLTWLMLMFSICWVVVGGNKNAAEIIMALVETASLWGVALGVLGISFMRGSSPVKSSTKNKQNKPTKLK